MLLRYCNTFAFNVASLSSLLLAVGNPKVNYFSLDIEGAELQVLRSVPWKLVDIEVRNMKLGLRFRGCLFANASLLRNLVLHYSFHLKTPPWKL